MLIDSRTNFRTSLSDPHMPLTNSDACCQEDIWHFKVRSFLYYTSNTVRRWVPWISWSTATRSSLSSNIYCKTNL